MKQNPSSLKKNAPLLLEWWHLSALPGLLVLLSYFFYFPSLNYDFQFDDLANITKLYQIRFQSFRSLFFQSSRWISYWLNGIYYSIGKFNPFYYRLGNVTFHTLSGVIFYYFLLRALSHLHADTFLKRNASLIAFCSALLFLLHPVQTQTVSYVIQGQLEGLAGLCIISIALLFLLSEQTSSPFLNYTYKLCTLIIGIFSCGTKEIAIISPLLLAVVDWFFIAQGSWAALKKRWLFHALVACIIFGMYLYLLKPSFFVTLFGLKMEARNNIGNVLTEKASDKILPLHFLISQFKVILHYIGIFFWPFNMSVEYDWKLVKSFFAPDCFFPFLVLVCAAGWLARLLYFNPTHLLGFGAFWFAIAIAPRSSILPSSELLTDYKTYTGSFGILFLLGWALAWLIVYGLEKILTFEQWRLQPYQIHGLCMLVLLPVGMATYVRNKVWRSAEEFWYSILQNAPDKARAYNNYGVALSEKGLYKESLPYYHKAIQLDPVYPDPLNNLAVASSCLGDVDGAINSLKRAISIQPYYPEGYNNLASFLMAKNELDQAEQYLKAALQMRPNYGKAHFNLGKIYINRQKPEIAHGHFKNACLNADLDNQAGFKTYAHLSLNLKKYEDAIIGFTRLLEFEPTAENTMHLANACFFANKFQQAYEAYKKVLSRNPQERNALYNLAETCVRLKQYEEAITYFTRMQQLPNSLDTVPLRIVYCHQQLGNTEQARILLEQYTKHDKMPAHLKHLAAVELKKIENQQKV